jgi:hypothetical protein
MSEGPREEHAAGTGWNAIVRVMDEEECLRLVAQHEVGRIAYNGRYGPTVLPVNYRLHEGSVVFRTDRDSPLDEDLRTGIGEAEYKVAFEIDDLDPASREGWSVLIQGSAHHVTDQGECEAVARAGVIPWPGGAKDLFICVRPTRVTGRHITHPGADRPS